MANRETAIQMAIRVAINGSGKAILWRNNVGFASAERVAYGLGKGSADLVGMLVPSGRFVALEVKTPVGTLTAEQRLWLAVVRKRGGFAACVRSVEDAACAIDRALGGGFE